MLGWRAVYSTAHDALSAQRQLCPKIAIIKVGAGQAMAMSNFSPMRVARSSGSNPSLDEQSAP
ncbi:hypothetical protein [Mesorhizobium sp. IMUNJ 23232]|uniref:hypothetical protein n=1 Tax=Mesorhizobium sp. IMUNJ 23232 TaxID=3376064 RepID=UPI0037ADBEAC